MNPNPLNYCTREAAQRLVDAGILLETEKYWYRYQDKWVEYSLQISKHDGVPDEVIARPTLTEVWRELPDRISIRSLWYELRLIKVGPKTVAGYYWFDDREYDVVDVNPTDAAIDLLIWVGQEITLTMEEGEGGAMQLSLNYKDEAYPIIFFRDVPKKTTIEIIENPHGGTNARDIKIGNITISIFEENVEI